MKVILLVLLLSPFIGLAQGNWILYQDTNSNFNGSGSATIKFDQFNNVWIGTSIGLYIYNGITWIFWDENNSGLPDSEITDIAFDPNGVAWIGTSNGGIARYDGTNWTVYDDTNTPMAWNTITAIGVDDSGVVWAGILIFGAIKYDGSTWQSYDTTNSGMPTNYINSFDFDPVTGNLWVSSSSEGIAVFDGTNWTKYTTSNSGLHVNDVYKVAFDGNGNKWIATNDGIVRFNSNWTTYTPQNSPFNTGYFANIAVDNNGVIWCTGSNGLVRFDGNTWTIWNAVNSQLPQTSTAGIDIDQAGKKWIGTSQQGIAVFYDGGPGSISSPQGTVEGCIFYDTNQNTIKDPGETCIPNQIVDVDSGAAFAITNSSGVYRTGVIIGNHLLKYRPHHYWQSSGSGQTTVIIPSTSTNIVGIDFGIYPTAMVNDVLVSLTSALPRCGTTIPFWITYINNGTTTLNGTVDLFLDPNVTMVTANPNYNTQTGLQFTWNYAGLSPGEVRQIKFDAGIPGISFVGQTIKSIVQINPVLNDTVIIDNADSLIQIIRCSFDPNDKLVDPLGYGSEGYIAKTTPYLNYTLRFQNTGNDIAYNITLEDSIDQNLRLIDMQIIGSSHQVEWVSLTERKVKFSFWNINLPDSNTNGPLSHGFVKYRVPIDSSLVELDEIHNTADIYFDFNPPIVTNTTLNTICEFFPMALFTITVDSSTITVQNTSTNANLFIWDFGDSSVDSSFEPSHVYSTPGNFTVKLTALNECGENKYSIPITIDSTKVEDTTSTTYIYSKEAESLTITPNPSDGLVFLKTEGQPVQKILIYDILGTVVYENHIPSHERIDVRGLSKGIYIVEVHTNIKVLTKKLLLD